ncbi:hypothetical protein [Arsenophonus sp.]|uniref:hypothetical protein n=1 Tax=Arsenophonus sp. TaxID=1872640 RepID=UPI00387949AF
MNIITEMRKSIEALTSVKVAPQGHAFIPDESDYIRIMLVSETTFDTGLVRQSLVAGKYQIDFISRDFERTLEMEKAVWRAWQEVSHGYVGNYPVQYVDKGRVYQDFAEDEDGGFYRQMREFTLYYSDAP